MIEFLKKILMSLFASLGPIKFKSVKEALLEAGIRYSDNDPNSILVWHDSLKDVDYFKFLQPWQVVNRIPSINVICRKAPFARIIRRIAPFFPDLFSFYPKSYILPFMNSIFSEELATHRKQYIVKPDSGSLGQGIIIIEPGEDYTHDDSLAVAQEYIPSLMIDNTKFDMRIYVLVASISPLKIYVYRDGLARFCSEQEGVDKVYSRITNVTLNKENTNIEDIGNISRLISDILPRLEKEFGADINKLWDQIDEAVVLSILAAFNFISKGEEWLCPPVGYSRCFQILGFDILLDQKLKPHVLEVNYRPSLDYYRPKERRMKVEMIKEAVEIAAPLNEAQTAVFERKWGWDQESWSDFISNSKDLKDSIKATRKSAENRSKFVKVYPTKRPEKRDLWAQVLKKVQSMPVEYMPGFRQPRCTVKGGEA